MDTIKYRVCPDHQEKHGVLNYICCSDECHTLICDFCLKGHIDHPIFSLSQLQHHRRSSEDAYTKYKGEFREKGEMLFNRLATEINKIIERNKNSFLKYLDGIADNIAEFQRLYDEFDKYPALNTRMIKIYMELKPVLNRNIFQNQMQFLNDQVTEFLDTINTKITNFKLNLEKDSKTNFSNMEVKKSVCVKDAKGYNPRAITLVEGSLVATGSKNGVVCLWDYDKVRECSRKAIDGEVFGLEYVPEHKLLYCACGQNIVVYKVINKALIKTRTLRLNSEVNNILYLGSNILATTEKQYGLVFRSTKNLATLGKVKLPEVFSMVYIPSRKRLMLDSPRGIAYVHVRKRIPSGHVTIGDINLSTRSCHGIHYLKGLQKFILPINSRKLVQLKGDLTIDKKIDSPANYGFASRPCAFVSNEDESQTILTTGSQGFLLIEKDGVKFVNLEKIKRSGAIAYVKERRILILAEFEDESIFIVRLKPIFD